MRELTVCTKADYPSKKRAKQAIRRLRNCRFMDDSPLRAYRCTDCGLYHLTSKIGMGYIVQCRK